VAADGAATRLWWPPHTTAATRWVRRRGRGPRAQAVCAPPRHHRVGAVGPAHRARMRQGRRVRSLPAPPPPGGTNHPRRWVLQEVNVWDPRPFGPACSDSLRGQRGARGPASPQKDQLRSHLLPPSLRLRVVSCVTVSPGENRARVCGRLPSAGQASRSISVGWGDTRGLMHHERLQKVGMYPVRPAAPARADTTATRGPRPAGAMCTC